MTVNTTAGSKILIGGTVADPFATSADALDGLTYLEVKRLMDLGDLGDSANDVPVSLIGENRVAHLKGQRDGGTMTIVFARDWADLGQKAMHAAFKANGNFAFQIQRNGTGGKVSYFAGVVMSERETYSQADSVQQVTFTVGVNSDVFTVEDTP